MFQLRIIQYLFPSTAKLALLRWQGQMPEGGLLLLLSSQMCYLRQLFVQNQQSCFCLFLMMISFLPSKSLSTYIFLCDIQMIAHDSIFNIKRSTHITYA